MFFATFSIRFLILFTWRLVYISKNKKHPSYSVENYLGARFSVWKKSGSSVMEKWIDLGLELTGVGNGSDIALEGKQSHR